MSVEQVAHLISRQKSAAESITETYSKLMSVGVEKVSVDRIEIRLSALKDKWSSFSLTDEHLNLELLKLNADDQPALKADPYFTNFVYKVTYEAYLDALEQLTILQRNLKEPATLSSSSVSDVSNIVAWSQVSRIPTINVPPFDGTPSKWLSFKGLFTSVFLSNQHLTPVEKLQHLKLKLVGSAEHLLRDTELLDANLDKAWNAVVDYYENSRVLLNSLFDNLFKAEPMSKESSQELERLYTIVTQVRRNLETMGRTRHDDLLIYIIVQKFDSHTRRMWGNALGSQKLPASWEQFEGFLKSRINSIQDVESKPVVLNRADKPTHYRQHVTRAHHVNSFSNDKNNGFTCSLCSAHHYLAHCPTYQQKSSKQKWEFIKSKRLCFNCLSTKHQSSKCPSSRRCLKCAKKHHTSLHQITTTQNNSNKIDPSTQSLPSTSNTAQVNHAYHSPSSTSTILLATAKVFVTTSQGKTLAARALLDQGSEVSFITENLVHHLQSPRQPSSLYLLGVGGHKTNKTKGITTINITSHFDMTTSIEIKAHILPKITSLIPPAKSFLINWPHLRDITLADPQFAEPGDIDLLIGADVYGQLLEGSIIKGPANTPVAQLTKLGWIISGPCSGSTPFNQNIQSFHCSLNQDLQSLLEKFWQQEEIFTTNNKKLSSVDQECEDHFLSTHSRDATGRYIVRLPFKGSVNSLGDSKPSAFRMINAMQQKFNSNPDFQKAYSNFLEEYKQLQHMVQIPDHESKSVPSFYLPHHGVLRESSLTTKLRVVFNGSCRVVGGVPLNELLHTGAKHQIDLFDVLIWLRQHRYIFASDIEKMYRQIQIHPEDRRFQRILWKDHDQLVTYQLTTVTYGLACAPFLALRATQQLIQDEGGRFPLAVDILNKGRYVDDVFGGANSIEEAQLKADQVYQLCMAGGLPLRKWISNHPHILKLIPAKYHAESLKVDIKDNTVKALGLSWNPQADYFFFNLTVSTSTIITKRIVLSQIAQLFDPLGLLSPLFINFKVFMQELWAIRVNWDDHLPVKQIQTWHSLLSTLSGLESIQIPRWIGSCSNEHVELHGFGDASQKAMAAVVYIKTVVGDVVNISLICSKTKVAPLKRMTIPRLELSASVMLVKLVTHCQAVLNMEKSPCYLWTDSSIVYTWVNNHPSKWKEFVHNRVCFIQETLPTAQWKHISGKINPADCATRGLTSTELKEHSIWWKGPSWLAQDPSSWPSSLPAQVNDERNLELKPSAHVVSCHAVSDQFIQFFSRYSSLAKLIRVITRIQRIINLFGKRSQIPVDARLTTSDLDIAHKTLIKTIQNKYFSKEIKIIRDKKELPTSNALLRLTPFCDADGLLRVGGRLMNAAIPLSAKQPYILPKDSPLNSLIIKHAHLQTLHGSVQNTLAYIRNTYWIIGGRVPVKSFILKCIICLRHRHSSAQQLMGQLPATRVNPSRPFAHSGVDYAGPFNVKTWKAKSVTCYKSWIAVFVCHATSAVHLEIVTDYSTAAFLAAYRRFTSRRGICQTLNSDCGTNFQGADRELKRFFSVTSTQLNEFATLIANHGTQWSFNPPAAPHFGGKFEAAVKLMKYHLKRVIGDTLLTYEELSTVLAQVEATLNSRPLCALTEDPDDLNALTPGHFLIGQPLNIVPEPNLELINITRLDRWQRLSQMLQSYWKMWSKAYLQRFQTIYKWNRELPNIKKGTLVLVIDERYPPAKWPLGRIIETHPGSNGLVRVVTIKTSATTIKRPIAKVCPLPISS